MTFKSKEFVAALMSDTKLHVIDGSSVELKWAIPQEDEVWINVSVGVVSLLVGH